MKKILFILLVLISNLSSSQTRLDSLLLNKINNYRSSKGLNSLIWNDSLYSVADNQSEYMFLTNEILHNQKMYDSTILKSFLPEPIFINRFLKHINPNIFRMVGENLVSHKLESYNNINLDSLSNELLLSWINSPSHNKLLLDSTMCEAAICNKYREDILEVDPENLIDILSSNRLYVAFECYTDPIW